MMCPAAHPAQHKYDQKATEPERDIRDDPEIRVRTGAENLLPVLHDEPLHDVSVGHPGGLHLENLRASRLAEMTLTGGHHAVDVLRAGAALAIDVRADALHLVALDLRFGLRQRRNSQK